MMSLNGECACPRHGLRAYTVPARARLGPSLSILRRKSKPYSMTTLRAGSAEVGVLGPPPPHYKGK